MRIITGSARGVRLETLAGEATRPTSERAKEAIFSMLGLGFEGRRILDLFAGSGQMGLEALSRGAQSATLVDASRAALEVVRRNAERTKLTARVRSVCSDALSYLKSSAEQPFHLVFLDPPYHAGLLPESLRLLKEKRLLAPGAVIVCESAAHEDVFGDDERLASCFRVLKRTRYGIAHITVLCTEEESE